MECPFCREEIRDRAVLCRFCGREWSLAKPHMERAAALEVERDALRLELETARKALDSLQAQRSSRWPGAPPPSSAIARGLRFACFPGDIQRRAGSHRHPCQSWAALQPGQATGTMRRHDVSARSRSGFRAPPSRCQTWGHGSAYREDRTMLARHAVPVTSPGLLRRSPPRTTFPSRLPRTVP